MRLRDGNDTHRFVAPDPAAIRLSVVTPTLNRPYLVRAAESVVPQLCESDEWLVVGDGVWPEPGRSDPRIRRYATERTARMGNHQRALALWLARGDFLVFLDDDDVLLPDALNAIRRSVAERVEVPHFFCLDLACSGIVLGRDGTVEMREVAGCQFVPPNRKPLLGSWEGTLSPDSEFDFIMGTLGNYGGLHCFHRDVVTHRVERSRHGAFA